MKTVVNFLFILMACLLQMTVEKDQGFWHRLKPLSHYLVIVIFLFRFFFMNSFIEIVEWATFKLISHSSSACLSQKYLQNYLYSQHLQQYSVFCAKKEESSRLPWLLLYTFIWFCNIFLSDLFCLFFCVFILFMYQRTHSIFDISEGFCMTIYEKRPRMAKHLAVPQCLQWHTRHFLQSASSCPQSSCWIWQRSLSQPCEFLRAAHEPRSGVSALSVLPGFNLKRVRNEGLHEQLCAWLSFVLFPALFFFFFFFLMWTDVSHCFCSQAAAAAAWGADQTLALLYWSAIRRM